MRFARFVLATLLFATLSACAQNDASRPFDQADYLKSDSQTPASNAPWSSVALPIVLRAEPEFVRTEQRPWDTHWLRLSVQPADDSELAIYIQRVRWPRSQGKLRLFIAGKELDTSGVTWNSPVLLTVPKSFADSGEGRVEVLVALSIERGQSGGLSRVWVGPAAELKVRHAWREFFQQRVPQVTAISFALLGAFTLFFWLKRRAEIAYLLFSVIAAINLVRNLHYYFVNPESFGDLFWWLTINSLGWLLVLSHLFAIRLHGQRFPKVEKALIVSIVLVSIASLVAVLVGVTIERWGPLTYLVQMLAGFAVPTLSTIAAWRVRSKAALFLAGALWLNVVLGFHDLLLQNWRITPESVILLPYAAITVLAVFFFSITQRYLEAIQNAEDLNVSLEKRLDARSRQLEESHRKLRLIEQQQAVTGERQRLMREMHDGLGSSLMSSLVMVEQGRLDSVQVAAVLRESIDDLKLTIDSLEPMGEDLLTLLGTLRYRLGKRLQTAGIKLEWSVQETPALPWLNPTSSLQILRILQETLTNTLKHAQAQTIRVETEADETAVIIRLIDNGVGFDVEAAKQARDGRGLQNLERRAATLSGSIVIESTSGRTVVELRLPRDRRAVER